MSSRRRQVAEKDLQWLVYIAENPAAGSYSEHGSVGIDRADLGPLFQIARLPWTLNRIPIGYSGLAQAYSRSESAAIDAVAENMKDGTKALQRNMNLQMLSDGVGNLNGPNPELKVGGTDLTGVQAMFDDGADVGMYAGIDRGTAVYWRSFVLRSPVATPRPITEELLWQVWNEAALRQFSITQATMSRGVLTQAALLLGQQRRFNFDGTSTPQFHAGADSVHFNGVELTGISAYENGRIDLWDEDLMDWNVLLDFTVEDRDGGNLDRSVLFAKVYSQMSYRTPFQSASIRDLISS